MRSFRASVQKRSQHSPDCIGLSSSRSFQPGLCPETFGISATGRRGRGDCAPGWIPGSKSGRKKGGSIGRFRRRTELFWPSARSSSPLCLASAIDFVSRALQRPAVRELPSLSTFYPRPVPQPGYKKGRRKKNEGCDFDGRPRIPPFESCKKRDPVRSFIVS